MDGALAVVSDGDVPPSPTSPHDPETERLRAENAQLRGQISELASKVAVLLDRAAELVAALDRKKAGKRAQKTTEGAPPASPTLDSLTDPAKAAYEDRPVAPELPDRPGPKPSTSKPKGRSPIPDHLPADESTSRPCTCGKCGSDRLDVVDAFDEIKLHVVPTYVRRRIVHRITVRCRACAARTTGEAPPAPYPRSKVTCEFLAWFLGQKFSLLTPLDRILRHLRAQGVHLSMGTAVRLVERGASLLDAIDGEHWRQLKAGPWMATDGTHLSVLVPGLPGSHRGYLEVYLRDGIVNFQYVPEKGSASLLDRLRGYRGTIQADAEHRFNGLYGPHGATEAGCNAHARRKFEAAEGVQPKLAAEGGAFLAVAFALEAQARREGKAGPELLAVRQERIAPVYAQLRTWMNAVEPVLLPDDPVAETIRYLRNHWQALTEWLRNAAIPPDNSAAEREFQTVAKARLSWLHAGSTEGAHRAATLLGVMATARNVGVDPLAYLAWVFERRGTHRHKFGLTAADLTPAAYRTATAKGPEG